MLNENLARGAALVIGGILIGLSAASVVPLITERPAPDQSVRASLLPPRTDLPPVNITLYGSSGGGWGFSNATIRSPGPNMTVYLGDDVRLTLIANESVGVRHNWFIDYNNDTFPNGDELTTRSPDFNVPGSVTVLFPFNPLHPGNWTYRCEYHSHSMFGTIRVLAEPRPVNLTLYGRSDRGWGFLNTTIHEPGPPLIILWGTNVSLTLIANDSIGVMHNWFIDYNADQTPNDGEPSSPDFNVPGSVSIVFPFSPKQTGNWTYYCRYHFHSMMGNISIVGGPPPSFAPAMLPLITTIMLGALGIVLVIAVIYHVRAVRAAKRMK